MTAYQIVYPSGKSFAATGLLSFIPHLGNEIAVIDQGKPRPVLALDPRAKITRTDTGELVWDGTVVNPNFGK